MSIRIATIEDDPQYRSSLELLIRRSTDFTLAESFASADAALARLTSAEPDATPAAWDLVLMDLDLPGTGGIAATRRIKERLPAAAVVVLTVFEEPATILEAICAGADGYLLKRTSADELLAQLKAIAAGGSPLSAGVARTVLGLVRHAGPATHGPGKATASSLDLTDRELEVLRCLVQGMSYKRVAAHLEVSMDTVRSHIRGVYGKLQVHNVASAVSRALREGLV